MKVGWLLDGDMFDHYRDELVAEVNTQGHVAKLVRPPSPPFRWEDVGCSYRETFSSDACVIVHGSMELVEKIYRERRWSPGVFATLEKYYCSFYANQLGSDWLNRDHALVRFDQLMACQSSLFARYGRDGTIFVRPDSPLKLFAGQLAHEATFPADVEFMGFYDVPPETTVLVSRPQQISREWRFVVADCQVIAGCEYAHDGAFEPTSGYSAAARELANKIAMKAFQPDPVWVIDICQLDDGSYWMLEIGCFSCADLYKCDIKAIVAAVNIAALRQWEALNSEQRSQ